jgi:hypothetical protein
MRPEKNELDFINCVRDLAKAGKFEGATQGIAKQLINSGQSSLNDRQREIFHTAFDKIIVEKCPVCQQPVSWPDMPWVIESGACSVCRPRTANQPLPQKV